jgi:hypothetical protein
VAQLAANAQGAFDWKFKGRRSSVLVRAREATSTKYHRGRRHEGITVSSEMIPEQRQRQKAVIDSTQAIRAST